MNIAIDVANALDYLHHHCQTPIIHCDLKPSNILLDDEMVGHVGDFGLAILLFDATQDCYIEQSSSIRVRGAIGYTPPSEYHFHFFFLIKIFYFLLLFLESIVFPFPLIFLYFKA